MKKILAIMLALATIFAFSACGEAKNNNDSDVLNIGVIQLVKHDALDAAYDGFVEGLKEAGYSEEAGNVKFDYKVATGKTDECQTIATQFAGKKDLILAIATGAAQAMVNAEKETPILVTAVTNPEGDCPGSNVSGTSDLGPIARQVQLAKEICPEIKKLGILYNSSEVNSKFQAELAIEACKAQNIAYQEFTVTAPTELQSTVENMKGVVDVCWIPTDNTCANNMPTIYAAAKSAKVMTICGESGMTNNGGLATIGAVDYFKLGKQTAAMAVKIFKGEAEVSDMPIEFQEAGDNPKVVINTDVAADFEIPADILANAEKVTLPAE